MLSMRKRSNADMVLGKNAERNLHTSWYGRTLRGRKTRKIVNIVKPRETTTRELKDTESIYNFLQEYTSATKDISEVARPAPYYDSHYMPAPVPLNNERSAALAQASVENPIWRDTGFFHDVLDSVLTDYDLSGLSVSMLDNDKQYIKYRVNFAAEPAIARTASLDGHAILSKRSFVLKDARGDWRTRLNFLVHGAPFVRFYAAVPLTHPVQSLRIGVLAVFCRKAREEVPSGLVHSLTQSAMIIVKRLAELETGGPLVEFGEPSLELLHNRSRLRVLEDVTNTARMGNAIHATYNKIDGLSLQASLLACGDSKAAASRASEALCQSACVDMSYVAEVRVALVFEVTTAEASLNWESETDVDSFLDSYSPTSWRIHVRRLGTHPATSDEGPEIGFESHVHLIALNSDRGIALKAQEYVHNLGSTSLANTRNEAMYKSAVFMPFHRSHPIVTKKALRPVRARPRVSGKEHTSFDRISQTIGSPDAAFETGSPELYSSAVGSAFSQDSHSLSQSADDRSTEVSLDFMRLKLLYGGYLLGGFNKKQRDYLPGDIDKMEHIVQALRNIYVCKR